MTSPLIATTSTLLLAFVLGMLLRPAIARFLARWLPSLTDWFQDSREPRYNSDLGLAELQELRPALAAKVLVKPAVPACHVPFELEAKQAARLREALSDEEAKAFARTLTKNEEVVEVLVALARWTPARGAASESDYHASLIRSMRRRRMTERMVEHPPASWSADDGSGSERRARPDLAVGKVLVELKANLDTSTSVDRAMGQMLRYLLAWKGEGPALLAICGRAEPEFRFLVRHYIDSWRKMHDLPVTVYFKGVDKEGDIDSLAVMAEVNAP